MIYLAQTDTTAGFLSKNLEEINILKGRAKDKPCLITSAKLSELQNLTRVSKGFKNLVRRAKKTTFIYPNHQAIRIVKDCKHAEFLSQNGFFYSSSANQHGKKFDEIWAKSVADVILDQFFFESTPSKILKIRGKRKLKIR
ncbi:Sua5 YciO YrdC YwlC family protein [Campylobacter molothri]|uniref:Sua5 YciO YrdC YwlC family protein n=1 Tax=Campylobacter molothri TaxID=1032242 RepID=UPI00301CCD73|nr:Sua5 YciO YrdC YwlC family protein [Campylobacter sp. RM17709]